MSHCPGSEASSERYYLTIIVIYALKVLGGAAFRAFNGLWDVMGEGWVEWGEA